LNVLGESEDGFLDIGWVFSMQVSKPEHLLTSEVEKVVGVGRFFQEELKVEGTNKIIVYLIPKPPVRFIRVIIAFRSFRHPSLSRKVNPEMPVELNILLPVCSCWEICVMLLGMLFHTYPPRVGVLPKP
jgi:hypothetical protein